MSRRIDTLLIITFAALLLIAPSAFAQTDGDAPARTGADAAFAPIQERFTLLKDSVVNLGGIGERDRPVIENLRTRTAAFNEQHPNHERGLAVELQLSIWLKDYDRADALYGRLMKARPDDQKLALAWPSYFARAEGQDERAEAAYRSVLAQWPEDPDVRLRWIEFLKGQNRYADAISEIESFEFDWAEFPDPIPTLSECLFAEHRFAEALEVLDRASEEAMDKSTSLKREVTAARTVREEYVTLWADESALRSTESEADDLPRAELVTSRGTIVVELFENEAPNTVANFISLAESGFYDETKFHRVLQNFMVQGGDPNSKTEEEGTPGEGGPGYRIPDEQKLDNARKHFAGTLAMGNVKGQPNTGGSQFFITHSPTPWLNGDHAVFGRVIEGLEVARKIKKDDVLVTVRVIRKRDHEYVPEKISDDDEAAEIAG